MSEPEPAPVYIVKPETPIGDQTDQELEATAADIIARLRQT